MYIESETPNSLLSGKRIVVTGAGRGLGRALAIVAADHGAEVVLLGRDLQRLRDVADTISVRTERVPKAFSCDLALPDSIRAACKSILENNPIVDVLINNGAPWLAGPLKALSDEDMAATITAAVTGTIMITNRLLPGLHRSTHADIVNIVSTAGLLGWETGGASVPFHAAKHGQSGFSDSLRTELKGSGIRVSAIYPPDFEDTDPVEEDWRNSPAPNAQLSNREVVSTVYFILTASRACNFPIVIMDNAAKSQV